MSLVEEEEEEDGPSFKVVAIFPEDFKRNAPISDAQWFERADKRPSLPYMKFSWSKKVLGLSTLLFRRSTLSHMFVAVGLGKQNHYTLKPEALARL